MPERPVRLDAQNSSTLAPIGVTTPRPDITICIPSREFMRLFPC